MSARVPDVALDYLAAEARYQGQFQAAMTMSVLTVQQMVAELQERRRADSQPSSGPITNETPCSIT